MSILDGIEKFKNRKGEDRQLQEALKLEKELKSENILSKILEVSNSIKNRRDAMAIILGCSGEVDNASEDIVLDESVQDAETNYFDMLPVIEAYNSSSDLEMVKVETEGMEESAKAASEEAYKNYETLNDDIDDLYNVEITEKKHNVLDEVANAMQDYFKVSPAVIQNAFEDPEQMHKLLKKINEQCNHITYEGQPVDDNQIINDYSVIKNPLVKKLLEKMEGVEFEELDEQEKEGVNEMGGKDIKEMGNHKMGDYDESEDDDTDIEEKKKVVFRGGVKKIINVPIRKKRLSAKQRLALKKARLKAHTGQAKLKRKKSLKKRESAGL